LQTAGQGKTLDLLSFSFTGWCMFAFLNGAIVSASTSAARRNRNLLTAALGILVLCFLSSGALAQATGDSRPVNEPAFPTTICKTLAAQLQAADGVISGYDETAPGASQLDTGRIQAAINACQSTAVVSAVELQASGTNNAFLIGPITLTNGVVLLVDPGVTVYGSRNPRDYDAPGDTGWCGTSTNDEKGCNPLIYATNAKNAGIMGYGVIDGRGEMQMIGSSQTWYDLAETGTQSNPRLLQLNSCTNFTLYKITLQNSPKFHVSVSGGSSNGLTAWGIKIIAPWTSANTDGFDPSGSNVTLTNSYIGDGDDNVAIKGGSTAASNMTFSHNHFYPGHGMSIGSETYGGVSNILVTDLAMAGNIADTSQNGLRIKSGSDVGGLVQNVLYDGVCIQDTDHPLVFNPNYSSGSGGIPQFQNVTVRNTHILNDPSYNYFSSTNVQLDGYSADAPLGLTLDNVVLDQPTDCSRFEQQYANITLGPGPVSFASCITATSDNRGNSNPPYDCANKFVYLAGELFSWGNSSAQPTITTNESLPVNVILQPVVSGDPLPNGTVAIMEGTTALTTVPLSTTGWLTPLTITGLTAGQHTLAAHFSGDSVNTKYAALDFGNLVVNVTAPGSVSTTTTLGATPAAPSFGGTVTFTATVTTATGTPTGTVTFNDGPTTLGTAALSSGVATFSTNVLAVGTHSGITASYGGDSNFANSASAPLSLVVGGAPTTTSLKSSAGTVVSGNSLTFTATVTSTVGMPSGSVTFYDGATQIGSSDLNAFGVATLSAALKASGSSSETHNISATYMGGGNFAGSTSSAQGITVAPVGPPSYSIAASDTTVNVAVGASGSTTLTLTPVNGFNSSVALSCGNVPSYLSCEFSQNPVPLSESATPITLKISVASTMPKFSALRLGDSGLIAFMATLMPLIVLPGRKKLSAKVLIAFLVLALILLAAGCGGGAHSITTTTSADRPPTGAQTLFIAGASGTNMQTLSLTVNITN
jgi:polygalacturonase